MIPIYLTIQGIYSYQEKQSIDFTKLTESNIFGIFGSVGSGKSTILEAITYSLYGKTDRLNLSGDNRNYNMMNLKSNELFIEFIFKTGKDDSEYKTTVKGRRNSKQFEEVKALDRAAYQKIHNEWIPIELGAIESAIGLSYENFKRTIIIPQGRFQEFLQLGTRERTQMMKELFNLEKFELYYKVISLENKNNLKVISLEGQMLQLGEINPDGMKVLEDRLLQIKTEIQQKTEALEKQQKNEEAFRKRKELSDKILEADSSLNQLRNKKPEYDLLEKNLREYEFCILNFKNLLDALKSNSEKVTLYEQNIQTDQSLLNSVLQQLNELESNFNALKTEFDGKELFQQQAEELDKIAIIQEQKSACQQINERISNGSQILSDTLKNIGIQQEAKEKLTVSIQEIKEQMPDMALLSEIKNWFTIQNALLSTQKELLLEKDCIQKELEETVIRKEKLFEGESVPNVSPGMEWEETERIFEQEKAKFDKQMAEYNLKTEHLLVQKKLEEYAANLEEGKPCPLCGAASHPEPLDAQSVSVELNRVLKQKKDTENALSSLTILEKKASEIATILLLKKELLAKTMLKQKEQEVKIVAHQKLFSWNDFKKEQTVKEAFEKAESLQTQLKNKETELESALANLEKENLNKDKYTVALEKFKHELTSKTTEIATLSNQIIRLNLLSFERKTQEEIQEAKNSCLRKYHQIEKDFQLANDKKMDLQKNRDILLGRLDVSKEVLKQEFAQKETLDIKLEYQLGESDFSGLSQVKDILARSMDMEQEKKKLNSYRQSLDYTEKQVVALRTEMGEQVYDAQQHQQVQNDVQQLAEDLNLCTLSQGKLSGEFEKYKTDLATQESFHQQIKLLQQRAEEIKTLKQLFKASGFVNYISSVYLQELCLAGNERFYKLTRQKLSLEVTEDNNFQVRDFMNGGKVRNIKTLSGGQTFQAALSLALALADNIQKITESNQNFFFLDEGFGSLDKDSLEVVFDTLKALRKENRIVGVISHVEEMQQEIDNHLKIVNQEEKGSIIHRSWE